MRHLCLVMRDMVARIVSLIMNASRNRPVSALLALAGAALAMLPVSAAANDAEALDGQPNRETIDQIVVVASKAERSIRDVAANVTVLSRDSLDMEIANSMADALRYVPGIGSAPKASTFAASAATA